jgi:hypothetical protein
MSPSEAKAKVDALGVLRGRSWLAPVGMPIANKHDYGNRVTRAMRESAPTEDVVISDLHAVQTGVSREKVRRMIEEGIPNKPPVVVRHAGKLYLHDGHHRVVARRLSGQQTVSAKVVTNRSPLVRWARQ